MKKLQPVYEARSAGRPKRSEKNEKTGEMRYNQDMCFTIDEIHGHLSDLYWYQYMQSGKNVAAVRMEVSVKRKMEKNRKEQKNNYVYMVCCADGSLYTGCTNYLEKRVRMHNAGKGAKYTKSRLPVTLVYHEIFEDRIQAMKREAAIKKMTRRDKLKLIEKRNRAGAETADDP